MAENFFDFHAKVNRRQAGARPTASAADKAVDAGRFTELEASALTVSQVNARVDRLIKTHLPQTLWVKAEISNCNRNRSSGHLYFSLKDSQSTLCCIMYRSDAERMAFELTDGMEVLAGGRLGVYSANGRYQLYVSTLRPLGQGALEAAFKQLHRRLQAEGLFARERKRPLYPYPRSLVIVTSRAAAALQDLLKVLRQFPWVAVRIYHVPVQGEAAAGRIAAAIAHLNASLSGDEQHLIILSRGGGSLEDLWAFNEEVVARAIAASRIPIVTGIGHEVDVSIADLVADYHAHTPTEAAQVVMMQWRGARQSLMRAAQRASRGLRALLRDARSRLLVAARHELFRRPNELVQTRRQRVDDRERSLEHAIAHRLNRQRQQLSELQERWAACHPLSQLRLRLQRVETLNDRLKRAADHLISARVVRVEAMAAQLRVLDPTAVLARGYSITMTKRGKAIRSASELKTGERLLTRFAAGEVTSIVEDQHQLPLFDNPRQ